jgi:hypothetical protein
MHHRQSPVQFPKVSVPVNSAMENGGDQVDASDGWMGGSAVT